MDQINKALLNQLTQKIGVTKGMQMSDEEIEKSFDKSELDLIEKAMGEGSKGGKIIGHTKSGKPIYENHDHPEHASFTSEDHRDAAYAHGDKADKEEKKENRYGSDAMDYGVKGAGEKADKARAQKEHHNKMYTEHMKIARKEK